VEICENRISLDADAGVKTVFARNGEKKGSFRKHKHQEEMQRLRSDNRDVKEKLEPESKKDYSSG